MTFLNYLYDHKQEKGSVPNGTELGFKSNNRIRQEIALFETILLQFRHCVRFSRYVVTTHAEEEMDEDRFSMFDVES